MFSEKEKEDADYEKGKLAMCYTIDSIFSGEYTIYGYTTDYE